MVKAHRLGPHLPVGRPLVGHQLQLVQIGQRPALIQPGLLLRVQQLIIGVVAFPHLGLLRHVGQCPQPVLLAPLLGQLRCHVAILDLPLRQRLGHRLDLARPEPLGRAIVGRRALAWRLTARRPAGPLELGVWLLQQPIHGLLAVVPHLAQRLVALVLIPLPVVDHFGHPGVQHPLHQLAVRPHRHRGAHKLVPVHPPRRLGLDVAIGQVV